MEITQSLIESFASNSSALANGRALAEENRYLLLNRSHDSLVYFGECRGSGDTVYRCSVDLSGAQPEGQCSCPSRQSPCKHCVGLLQSALMGRDFIVAAIPEDIAAKKERQLKRAGKKADDSVDSGRSGRAVSARRLSAQRKKIKAQLDGISTAEQMLTNIVRIGAGSVDLRMRQALSDQAENLGNYYIPGVQAAFNSLVLSLDDAGSEWSVKIAERLTYLYSLLKKGREYLEGRLGGKEQDMSSNIEELLGKAWKLHELRDSGCYMRDARIVQLAFGSYDDNPSLRRVEEGAWICLNDGRLYKTQNFRPFHASQYIKSADSVFDVVEAKELFVYPGGMNPRIRWDRQFLSQMDSGICAGIKNLSKKDFAGVCREIKAVIKNPLSDKRPMALVRFAELGKIKRRSGEEDMVIRDETGSVIVLRDDRQYGPETLPLLEIYFHGAKDEAMLLQFYSDLAEDMLYARPMSIVTDQRIMRLNF